MVELDHFITLTNSKGVFIVRPLIQKIQSVINVNLVITTKNFLDRSFHLKQKLDKMIDGSKSTRKITPIVMNSAFDKSQVEGFCNKIRIGRRQSKTTLFLTSLHKILNCLIIHFFLKSKFLKENISDQYFQNLLDLVQ